MTKFPGLGLIEAASRLVPERRREEWRREWEAETTYVWQRSVRAGRSSRLSSLRLRLRVLSCFADALLEMKEEVRMAGLLNDLRYAVRGLLRHPAFTIVAVLTLALGIGANTAVFTLVDGVLIRPLPFPEPEGLVSLEHLGREGQDELPMSDGLYLLYGEQSSSLGTIALYASSEINLMIGDEPERVPVQYVTPSFFEVLQVSPTDGRGFLPEEELPDADPVVILSDGFWRRAFGADPAVLDRTLEMNGLIRQVVGVMPPDFGYPDREAQVWLPYPVDPAQAPLAAFGAGGIARMNPGHTPESVYTELQGLISRLSELFPESGAPAFLAEVGLQAKVRPLKEVLVGDVSTTLWILLGTVGFVLLIACANVANLLLVRAESRQRELALRLAMGAGRQEIVRYFMGESLLLAAAGGGLGVLFSSWALGLSTRFVPTDIPRMAEVGVDLRVLGFTAAISLGCAIFFGLFPLLRYGANDLASQLKDGGGRGATRGRERHRLRNGLVVVQVAMALVLLVGAGLMFRSFVALRAQDPGFQVENVLTARLSLPAAEAEGWEAAAGFFRQLRERMAVQPGVEAVGIAQRAPLAGGLGFVTIGVEDHPRGPEEMPIFSSQILVGEGYFEAMGIQLLEGRAFQPGDGAEGTRAVVVSENFARHWWPDTSPLGRRLGDGGEDGSDWWVIVGVVEDVNHQDLQGVPEELVYYPITVGPTAAPQTLRTADILVKVASGPLQALPVLRRELRELNPRIPLSNPRTMGEVFSTATARTSFTMAMLGAASGIALLLGLIGIYGVISYVVSQRTKEIGVRMALGATAPSVRAMVVRQGLWLSAGGVALGLLAAGALSSVMSSLLFGVSALDPVTYAVVGGALVGVSVVASWLPARRAAAVNPTEALREE
jgi:putative ABC transport system permease protein